MGIYMYVAKWLYIEPAESTGVYRRQAETAGLVVAAAGSHSHTAVTAAD